MAGSRIHPLAVHAPDWLRRLLTRPRLYDRLIGILTALICSVVIALGYNLFIEPALLAFYHSIIVGLQGTQRAVFALGSFLAALVSSVSRVMLTIADRTQLQLYLSTALGVLAAEITPRTRRVQVASRRWRKETVFQRSWRMLAMRATAFLFAAGIMVTLLDVTTVGLTLYVGASIPLIIDRLLRRIANGLVVDRDAKSRKSRTRR